MKSRDEFIADLVQNQKDAAVFVIEMKGLDEAVIQKAIEVLDELVGQRRVTHFRVR